MARYGRRPTAKDIGLAIQESPEPWSHQLPGETPLAFAIFTKFLATRSVRSAHESAPTRVSIRSVWNWKRRFMWDERVRLHDALLTKHGAGQAVIIAVKAAPVMVEVLVRMAIDEKCTSKDRREAAATILKVAHVLIDKREVLNADRDDDPLIRALAAIRSSMEASDLGSTWMRTPRKSITDSDE